MTRYARGAAIMCGSPNFQRFLQHKTFERVDTAERAAASVRHICGVSSRRELDTSEIAAKQWRLLVHEYNEWATGRRFKDV